MDTRKEKKAALAKAERIAKIRRVSKEMTQEGANELSSSPRHEKWKKKSRQKDFGPHHP